MSEPFKPDWDEKAVLVEEMQRMAKELQERNFCSRCGKRLGTEADVHTCTPPPPRVRFFDDYGNKIV